MHTCAVRQVALWNAAAAAALATELGRGGPVKEEAHGVPLHSQCRLNPNPHIAQLKSGHHCTACRHACLCKHSHALTIGQCLQEWLAGKLRRPSTGPTAMPGGTGAIACQVINTCSQCQLHMQDAGTCCLTHVTAEHIRTALKDMAARNTI